MNPKTAESLYELYEVKELQKAYTRHNLTKALQTVAEKIYGEYAILKNLKTSITEACAYLYVNPSEFSESFHNVEGSLIRRAYKETLNGYCNFDEEEF